MTALRMMKILAALSILSLVAGVIPTKQVTCSHSITCPCGNTGNDVKVCSRKRTPEDEQDDPCIKWSKCKACQDGLDGCLECPDGLNGPLCSTANTNHLMYCDNPGPMMNGKIKHFAPFVGQRSGSKRVAEDTPEYPEGTRLEYHCDDGYLIKGKNFVMCETSGLWSDIPPKCESDCGKPEVGSRKGIVSDNQNKISEWPWVVAIAVQDRNNYPRIICQGALINPRTVITVAHCLTRHKRFFLYFGKYYRYNGLDDDQVQNVTTDNVIIHPHFNEINLDSDIGLIKFKPSIKYSLRVKPICLPSLETTSVNLNKGQSGFASGWGLTKKRLPSAELITVRQPFVENKDCLESYRTYIPNFKVPLTQNMFCAGYVEANKDALCRGSSGVPLAFYNQMIGGYTLEGLATFSVEGRPCGVPTSLTLFTKVYNYLPWILRNY